MGVGAAGSGRFLEPADELHERYADRLAVLLQLDQVHAPLAALVVADPRVVGVQPASQFHLGQSGFLSNGPQERLKVALPLRVDALLHGSSVQRESGMSKE